MSELKLQLKPDDRAHLEAQAHNAGLSLEEYVRTVLERIARQADPQKLSQLPRDERNRLLARQADEAAPLYEADLAQPVEARELTAFTALDGEEVHERTP